MKNLRTRASVGLVAVALGIGGAACSGSDDDSGDATAGEGAVEAATVSVEDNFFDLKKTTVSVGGTVTWEWAGAEPHNVSGDGFESEIQQEGSFEHTFNDAGTFDYVCTIHPGMEGTIEVTK